MISGKLPNNTVWWLSTDGLKVWIESKDLEKEKFTEKGFYIARDNIFKDKKYVGELTTSRLESRKYKDAWIIKLDAIAYVYPELIEEINRKEIEEKEKKKVKTKSKKDTRRYVADQWPKKEVTIDLKKFLESKKRDESKIIDKEVVPTIPKIEPIKVEPEVTIDLKKFLAKKEAVPTIPKIEPIKAEPEIIENKELANKENIITTSIENKELTNKENIITTSKKENVETKEITTSKKENVETKEITTSKKENVDYFDISRQYVSWIKDEIEKSNGHMIISTKDLKTKMGEEYINMHDFRIYYGLKKLLSSIGIIVESGNVKGENIIVMKKS